MPVTATLLRVEIATRSFWEASGVYADDTLFFDSFVDFILCSFTIAMTAWHHPPHLEHYGEASLPRGCPAVQLQNIDMVETKVRQALCLHIVQKRFFVGPEMSSREP